MIARILRYLAIRRARKAQEQCVAEFDARLAARKAVRIVQQERARKAYWQGVRKRWANDRCRMS